MEFKYRAVDVDRPPTATASARSGFLWEPPITGCNMKLPSENTSKPTEDHCIREAIRREIEKELIRAEIIAAETARRRELVAEVMREMAAERELAMLGGTEMGVSFEERLTMWINEKQSPYQNSLFENHSAFSGPLWCTGPHNQATPPKVQLPPLKQISNPAKANKDKLIVLDRPGPEGAKRKAEAPPAAGPEERHLLSVKKKRRGEWNCTLCKVSATCERGLNQHLQGKRHKAKEAALRSKQKSNSSLERTSKPQVDGKKQGETAEKCRAKSKMKFWCEICNVGTSGESVMQEHEKGKKHKARIQQQKKRPEAAPTTLATVSSAIAAAAIAVSPSDDMTETDGVVVDGKTVKTKSEEKPKFKFWCEICSVGTFTEALMKTHVVGKKHKTRVEKQRDAMAVSNPQTDQRIFSCHEHCGRCSDHRDAAYVFKCCCPWREMMTCQPKSTVSKLG